MSIAALLPYIISALALIVPALGYAPLMHSPKLWILLLFSLCALALQPRFDAKNATADDRGTARVFAIIVLPLTILPILEARYLRGAGATAFTWLSLSALLTMALGLALRTWSIRTLGKYFTLHVNIAERQPLIRIGPYRYVRHPSYTGALMFLLASPLFIGAYWSFALSACAWIAWFRWRIRHEEAALARAFGEDFAEWTRTTPPLIPRLI